MRPGRFMQPIFFANFAFLCDLCGEKLLTAKYAESTQRTAENFYC
jgi:hypothetical protein